DISRKYYSYCTYHSFSPLALRLWFHPISLYRLNQTMDTEGMLFHQTLHQGELEQVCHELLKQQGISNRLLKRHRPISRAIPEQFLWNAIRRQKRTELKEFGRRRVGLLYLLKREQPGGSDRVGIVGRRRPTLGEQG